MLYNILLILQLVVSLAIIGLVLIQHGKGADAGAAFGSGASGTVFGSRGSGNFLSRATAILAAVFFINCLALAWIVAHQPEQTSLVNTIPAESTTEKPATTDANNEAAPKPATTPAAPAPAPTVADQIPADSGAAAGAGTQPQPTTIPE
ncbi:MAG: preprotein translocase subunit SecG [bacterium]